MDFYGYFDKNPLYNYTLGPSGSGALQIQPFTTPWIGWFEPASGVKYQKLASFGTVEPFHFQETGNPNAKYFDFTFESGSKFFYATSTEDIVNVVNVVNGVKTTFTFSGKSPLLFNNSVLQISGNETTCFYTKNDNVIYFRNFSENFANQHVYYSGDKLIKRLNVVSKNPITGQFYRMGIFGLDTEGNGELWYSDKFPPLHIEYFQNFSGQPSGDLTTLSTWDIEENPAIFLDGMGYSSDDFTVSPSGTINSLSGANNMSGGYFISG